jgi:hypothetical protein
MRPIAILPLLLLTASCAAARIESFWSSVNRRRRSGPTTTAEYVMPRC